MGISLGTAATVATIAAAAVAATAQTVGTAAGIHSSVNRYKQDRANAQMQEEQMLYNKRLEEREAAQIEQETAENARRQRQMAAEMKARQRALLGKSGAALESGSPLALLGQTISDSELSVMDTHRQGYMESQRHREQARMYGYHARVAKKSAPTRTSLGLNIGGQVAQYHAGQAGLVMNVAGNLTK